MNIPKEAWMIFMLGGFAGILYSHFLRPALKKLIQRLKGQWHMHRSAVITDAYCTGYGWAWSSVVIECYCLDWVRDTENHPYNNTPLEYQFTQGVKAAIEDIEHFQCLREERT